MDLDDASVRAKFLEELFRVGLHFFRSKTLHGNVIDDGVFLRRKHGEDFHPHPPFVLPFFGDAIEEINDGFQREVVQCLEDRSNNRYKNKFENFSNDEPSKIEDTGNDPHPKKESQNKEFAHEIPSFVVEVP